jgi:hypothetical protein
MKYQSLLLIASGTKILAWIAVVVGILSSIRLGITATTPLASITLLLGGLLATAMATLLLLATSKFIHLFVDMRRDLREIADSLKKGAAE